MKKTYLICVALMLLLCSGCMYIVDGYCIIYNGRAYEYMYNDHWSCKDAWDLPDSKKHEENVYYGFKSFPKKNKEKAWIFDETGLDMFLIGEDYELYGDRDYKWPNCEGDSIETITIDMYEESNAKIENGVSWTTSMLELSKQSDLKILSYEFSQARYAKNWKENKESIMPTHSGAIYIHFKDFKPVFHYGYLGKTKNGWFLQGAWQTDIDDYDSIKNKIYYLSEKANLVLNRYWNAEKK